MQRISWENYFMEIAQLVSKRATCTRLHVGAVIVKDKQIVATGYNGSVSGMDHCEEVGCDIVDGHCVATIHAEQNALLQCAKYGISVEGATIFITHFPCYNCAKYLAQTGIKTVYYKSGYNNDNRTFKLFNKLGIRCIKVEGG